MFIFRCSHNLCVICWQKSAQTGGAVSINLGFILDYIYHGEVNLYQEQLDSFLESAQKLEIEGLIGMSEEGTEQNMQHHNEMEQETQNVYYTTEAKQIVRIDNNLEVKTQRHYSSSSDVARIDVTSLTTEEIERKIKEQYKKIDGDWTCITCDYTSPKQYNVRKHVEKHIDGLSYSCDLCNKEFRLSNSLHNHKSTCNKTTF